MAFLLAATLVVALVRAGLNDDAPATQPKAKKTPTAQVRSAGGPSTKSVHTVRAGDTLITIAAASGVSVTRLLQLNPEVEPTSLFIGDKIHLR